MDDTIKYILLFASLATVILGARKEHGSGRGFTTYGYGVVAIGVIVFILSIVSECSSNQETKSKELKLNSKIDTLNNDNDSLRGDIRTLRDSLKNSSSYTNILINNTRDSLNRRIGSLIQDNYKLSMALTDRALEINRNIMGSGEAIVRFYGDRLRLTYMADIKSQSEYPLYNLSLLEFDMDRGINCLAGPYKQSFLIDSRCFFENTSQDNVDFLGPQAISFLKYTYPYTNEKYKTIEIKISSKSTKTIQQTIVKLQDGPCPQSYRLYKILPTGAIRFIKSENPLNISDAEWGRRFFPLKNRVITDVRPKSTAP